MSWARFDDAFPDHPKVCPLSDAAFRVETTAIIYAARFATDGRIPDGAIGKLHPDPATAKAAVAELVEYGLMERSGRGYLLHDYTDWNPSREQIEKVRAERAKAGQIGGTATANAKANAQQNSSNILIPSETTPDPLPLPEPLRDPSPLDSPETLSPSGDAVGKKPRAPNSSWSAEACDDWTTRMDSPPNGGKIGRSLKPLVGRHTWKLVRPAWQRYLRETPADRVSPARFAETFGHWHGTAAPAVKPNPIATASDRSDDALAAFARQADAVKA